MNRAVETSRFLCPSIPVPGLFLLLRRPIWAFSIVNYCARSVAYFPLFLQLPATLRIRFPPPLREWVDFHLVSFLQKRNISKSQIHLKTMGANFTFRLVSKFYQLERKAYRTGNRHQATKATMFPCPIHADLLPDSLGLLVAERDCS